MILRIKYTKPLRNLLKESGIWLNFSGHKYEGLLKMAQIFRFFYLLGVYLLLLNKLFNQGLSFLLTPSAVFIPLGGVLLTLTAVMMLKFDKIHYLVDQHELNFSAYKRNWEKEVIRENFHKFEMFINFGRYFARSFALLYLILPLLIDGIRALMGSSRPYSLPTPLEGYLDASSRNVNFYLIILASDVWLWMAMSTSIGVECVMFFMVSYSTTEIKILKRCLDMLHPDNQSDRLTLEVDRLPPWNLGQIITYHQQIIRLNRLQRSCISLPYVIQNVSVTLSLCFIMFLIRQLIGQNTLMLLLTVTFIFMMVGLVFVVCFAGELLQDESEELFQRLYEIPWYRQSPRVRKDILLMMMKATDPLVLDYKHNTISLPAFRDVMNNSYSCFMLMNSVSPS